jgi:hypothetical protein
MVEIEQQFHHSFSLIELLTGALRNEIHLLLHGKRSHSFPFQAK